MDADGASKHGFGARVLDASEPRNAPVAVEHKAGVDVGLEARGPHPKRDVSGGRLLFSEQGTGPCVEQLKNTIGVGSLNRTHNPVC